VSVEDRVRKHFDLDARRFDAIYDEDKGPVARFIDHVWRGVVRRRFDLTLERLAPLTGRSVLDVGCGSGRYCIAYALQGAQRVVGLDFAPEMIGLAEAHARRAGVAHRCQFLVTSFPGDGIEGKFDASTAMGYFDYVADPTPSLTRMRELTTSTTIMSFPKSREWRVPVRRLRFRLAGCPLFLYSVDRVRGLLQDAGISRYEIVSLDRDYVVVARP
jgi:cyclopropane fatty-acyl-phospholipid synthase-like methyltransferase